MAAELVQFDKSAPWSLGAESNSSFEILYSGKRVGYIFKERGQRFIDEMNKKKVRIGCPECGK